jgi:hypothetical protein
MNIDEPLSFFIEDGRMGKGKKKRERESTTKKITE